MVVMLVEMRRSGWGCRGYIYQLILNQIVAKLLVASLRSFLVYCDCLCREVDLMRVREVIKEYKVQYQRGISKVVYVRSTGTLLQISNFDEDNASRVAFASHSPSTHFPY